MAPAVVQGAADVAAPAAPEVVAQAAALDQGGQTDAAAQTLLAYINSGRQAGTGKRREA